MMLFATLFVAVPVVNAEPEKENMCAWIDGDIGCIPPNHWYIDIYINTHGCCGGSGYMLLEMWVNGVHIPPSNVGSSFSSGVFEASSLDIALGLYWSCTSNCRCRC